MADRQTHTTEFPAFSSVSTHRVISVRDVSDSAYVLRLERGDVGFRPGQYISVGVQGDINMREYSIYSRPDDDFLEVLVKEVEGGLVSRKLRRLVPGDSANVEGPFGFFLIEDEWLASRKFYFIGTGTGISPFHSFTGAYPDIDYTLLHGVRFLKERYDSELYAPQRYVSCVTREDGGTYRGRVTDYLRQNPPPSDALFFLCGNCDMIYEAFDILTSQGTDSSRLFAEVYF